MKKGRKRFSPIWKVSETEFKSIIKKSQTYTEALSFFDLKNKGGNYKTLKKRIAEDKVDISHFLKKEEIVKQIFLRKKKPLKEVLVRDSAYSRSSLKKRLIEEKLIENKCDVEDCPTRKMKGWLKKPLVLILDHINGIGNDHRRKNLRLLCPNCNSQTKTFAGRNTKHIYNKCKNCKKKIRKKSKLCNLCQAKSREKINWPEINVLTKEVEKRGLSYMGRMLGVTANAVKKRITKFQPDWKSKYMKKNR